MKYAYTWCIKIRQHCTNDQERKNNIINLSCNCYCSQFSNRNIKISLSQKCFCDFSFCFFGKHPSLNILCFHILCQMQTRRLQREEFSLDKNVFCHVMELFCCFLFFIYVSQFSLYKNQVYVWFNRLKVRNIKLLTKHAFKICYCYVGFTFFYQYMSLVFCGNFVVMLGKTIQGWKFLTN